MRSLTEQTVINLISSTLEVEPYSIKPDSSLMDDLEASPSDIINLHFAIEEELRLSLHPNVVMNCRTVQDIIEIFNKYNYSSQESNRIH